MKDRAWQSCKWTVRYLATGHRTNRQLRARIPVRRNRSWEAWALVLRRVTTKIRDHRYRDCTYLTLRDMCKTSLSRYEPSGLPAWTEVGVWDNRRADRVCCPPKGRWKRYGVVAELECYHWAVWLHCFDMDLSWVELGVRRLGQCLTAPTVARPTSKGQQINLLKPSVFFPYH